MIPPAERRCDGTKPDGTACTSWTVTGTSSCVAHGGRSQAVALVKARRREDAAVERKLRSRHLEPVGNAVSEMVTLIAETKTWKNILADQLADMPALEDLDDRAVRRLRPLVECYERSLDRLGRFLTDMVRLDLEARLVRIQSLEVERVGKAVLDSLADESDEVRARVTARLAENLRALE